MVYYSSYVCCNIGIENCEKSDYEEKTPQTQMSGVSCPYFLSWSCVFFISNIFGINPSKCCAFWPQSSKILARVLWGYCGLYREKQGTADGSSDIKPGLKSRENFAVNTCGLYHSWAWLSAHGNQGEIFHWYQFTWFSVCFCNWAFKSRK